MSEQALATISPQESRMCRVEDIVQQQQSISELMKRVMQENQHYGKIPGCGDKPALLKAGAEKLCALFRLADSYKVDQIELGDDHREYRVTCTLTHIGTGKVWSQGDATCSTKESKYRYRNGERKCPQCGKPTIIKGKEEY